MLVNIVEHFTCCKVAQCKIKNDFFKMDDHNATDCRGFCRQLLA